MNKKKKLDEVSLHTINQKICDMHKIIEANTKEIQLIKEEIAYGKGGVKVLLWIIGFITTFIAAWNFIIKK